MGLTRRQALAGAFAGAAGCATGPRRPRFASAATDREGRHWLAVFDDQGETAFRTPLPARGHEAVPAPDRSIAFVPARRPGNWAAIVDIRDGRLVEMRHAAPGRHFYGHGVFSADGTLLLTPENDYEHGQGVIVVRSTRSLDVLGEFASGGVGPHEIKWLRGNVLAVANGGIRTHPGQPRKKLNLRDMQPNLTLLDPRTGATIARIEPPNHQASIRHMAVAGDRVVLAVQYEGSPTDATPLLFVFDASTGKLAALPVPLAVQYGLRQYIASVCVDPATGRAMATAPHAHLATYWDLDQGYLSQRRVRDAGGVALDERAGQFIVTNGGGAARRFDAATGERQGPVQRFPGLRWDNHLTAV